MVFAAGWTSCQPKPHSGSDLTAYKHRPQPRTFLPPHPSDSRLSLLWLVTLLCTCRLYIQKFIFLPINSGQVLSLRDARYSLTLGKIRHLMALKLSAELLHLYRIVVDRKVGCTFKLSKKKVYKNLIRLKQNKPINDSKTAQWSLRGWLNRCLRPKTGDFPWKAGSRTPHICHKRWLSKKKN